MIFYIENITYRRAIQGKLCILTVCDWVGDAGVWGCVGERWKSGVRGVSGSNGDWKGPHEHGAYSFIDVCYRLSVED